MSTKTALLLLAAVLWPLSMVLVTAYYPGLWKFFMVWREHKLGAGIAPVFLLFYFWFSWLCLVFLPLKLKGKIGALVGFTAVMSAVVVAFNIFTVCILMIGKNGCMF